MFIVVIVWSTPAFLAPALAMFSFSCVLLLWCLRLRLLLWWVSLFWTAAGEGGTNITPNGWHRPQKHKRGGTIYMCIYILFASRYPTSPSEGSFLYDCLKEGLQIKEKLEKLGTRDGHNWDVQASFWVIRHYSTALPAELITGW
jgi:hypothetical protein